MKLKKKSLVRDLDRATLAGFRRAVIRQCNAVRQHERAANKQRVTIGYGAIGKVALKELNRFKSRKVSTYADVFTKFHQKG